MHEFGVRLVLDRLEPAGFGEHLFGQRDEEVRLLVLHVVADVVRLLHVDDEVRLADQEAARVLPLTRRRTLRGIALGRAALGPGHDRVDLRLGEGPLVQEDAGGVIRRVPWRHLATLHEAGDGTRPRPDLFVGHQRHRRHHAGHVVAARAVAGLAVLLEDGQHVLMEGDGFPAVGGHRHGGQSERAKNEKCSDRAVHARLQLPTSCSASATGL